METESSDITIYCPHCGKPNRDTAAFCAFCGTSLSGEHRLRRCPNCKESVAVTDTFCANCGYALDAGLLAGENGTQARLGGGTGQLASNTTLRDRYMVQRRIAKGGMGAVYEAIDLQGGKRWAIKEMSQASLLPEEREQAVADFEREAKLLQTLNHPNLPKVQELFAIGPRYYMVMEFVAGRTLQQVIEDAPKPLTQQQVLVWSGQLCDVLGYLHRQQPPIIYRDLKPGNVMVLLRGRESDLVKLIDFGIARFHQPGKTRDTTTFGTAGYSPPEQYGREQTDARSDIYALGATLHHLLTHRDPGLNPFNFGPITPINPAVSNEVEEAILRAVALDPAERWQSVSDFKAALQGKAVGSPRPTPVRVGAAEKNLAPATPAKQATPARSTTRPAEAAPRKKTAALAVPGEERAIAKPFLRLAAEEVDLGIVRPATLARTGGLTKAIPVGNTGGGALRGTVRSRTAWLVAEPPILDQEQEGANTNLRLSLLPRLLPTSSRTISLPNLYRPLARFLRLSVEKKEFGALGAAVGLLAILLLVASWLLGPAITFVALAVLLVVPQAVAMWVAVHLFIFVPVAQTLLGRVLVSSNGGEKELRVKVQAAPTRWQQVRGVALLVTAFALEVAAAGLAGWWYAATYGWLPDPAATLRGLFGG